MSTNARIRKSADELQHKMREMENEKNRKKK